MLCPIRVSCQFIIPTTLSIRKKSIHRQRVRSLRAVAQMMVATVRGQKEKLDKYFQFNNIIRNAVSHYGIMSSGMTGTKPNNLVQTIERTSLILDILGQSPQ